MYNNNANIYTALGQMLSSYLNNNMTSNTNNKATTNQNSILLPATQNIQQSTANSLIPNTFTAQTVPSAVSAANLGNNLFRNGSIYNTALNYGNQQSPYFY